MWLSRVFWMMRAPRYTMVRSLHHGRRSIYMMVIFSFIVHLLSRLVRPPKPNPLTLQPSHAYSPLARLLAHASLLASRRPPMSADCAATRRPPAGHRWQPGCLTPAQLCRSQPHRACKVVNVNLSPGQQPFSPALNEF